MQNLVFPVTLRADRASMNIDGAGAPLQPGMSVSVEIRTGKRRILEYLFSPLPTRAAAGSGCRSNTIPRGG